MEMLAMVHRGTKKLIQSQGSEDPPQPDLLYTQKSPTPFITPESSQVTTHLETERYYCPEHGPYMADKDGEMGGCLGCADVNMNISMSRTEKLEVVYQGTKKRVQSQGSEDRPQPDLLHTQKSATPFITPEASQVSTHLETERYYCPEHGPYMADKDGEMGGCLGCADLKMNISMSRDCSYNDLGDNNIVDHFLDGSLSAGQGPDHPEELVGTFGGMITRSRFDATKELFDYMLAYESSINSAGDCEIARQREIKHNFGILNRRRSRNLSKSISGNLSQIPGKLIRVTSRDDLAISYKDNEIELLLSRGAFERSHSVPEKLNLITDVKRCKRHLWTTSLLDIST